MDDASTDELKEINSLDKSLMEKVALVESLSDDEKQTIYTMLHIEKLLLIRRLKNH